MLTGIQDNPYNNISDYGLEFTGRYYSVYRGLVLDNVDPGKLNRLKICVPEILNGLETWALPKNIPGSFNSGVRYLLPKIGEVVWVSFEKGHPQLPLWEYHPWADGEVPEPFNNPDVCGMITPGGISVILKDEDQDDQVDITIPGDSYILVEGLLSIVGKPVEFNYGKNGGMVKIQELTDKLNNLIKELEQLKQDYQQHTHSGVTTGGGTSGAPIKPYTNNFTQFNKDDYEDLNCTH